MAYERLKELRNRRVFIPTASRSLGPRLWTLWNEASNPQRAAFCTRAGLQPIPGCEEDVYINRSRGRRFDRGNHKAK
jgi:hypothetical protein